MLTTGDFLFACVMLSIIGIGSIITYWGKGYR